ncbi:biotin--[acetyl-CoA-carboxylase] ligase [Lactobacillus alvi]|uniref:Bifunctional ligase/repressor BirA n=1 Tax=Limosilactobacillus alvi TaxID=990412 RepID=A0ABS2EMW8_9LACO|nr:biotin--[acetyl-CoA-carboxylase] ligase [Limosilactobacillus alvi]MBM6753706.1 biotin--[acetyl-CoA-carboxylase] ligase [Limosilactobacillus alvi]
MATTREKVLAEFLKQPKRAITGSELATRLQISRESIWKAIQALRKTGFEIQGQPAKGYIYLGTSKLSAPVIQTACRKFRGQVLVFDELSSTQDQAKAAISHRQVALPAVWLAESQTAGYGRRGRQFFSPAATGLYFSVAFQLVVPLQNPGLLTTGVAEAIWQVLHSFYPQADLQLKWVNDIYCNGKKVVGILTEAVTDLETQSAQTVVIGCGINLSTTNFPTELASKAGKLGDLVDRNQLAAALLDAIQIRIGDFTTGDFLTNYRKHSLVLGRPVELRGAHETVHGTATQINDDGALVVITPEGSRTFVSGEVTKVNVK